MFIVVRSDPYVFVVLIRELDLIDLLLNIRGKLILAINLLDDIFSHEGRLAQGPILFHFSRRILGYDQFISFHFVVRIVFFNDIYGVVHVIVRIVRIHRHASRKI